MRFLASVPVTWDETRVLEAQPGKVIVLARRKGDKWFIGAMNGDNEHERRINLNLCFLGSGSYRMTSFADGTNAFRHAEDYTRRIQRVDHATTLPITMVRNGGFCAIIENTGNDE